MISIITPVLNGADFIKDNIESIRKLDIPFEHIVVDGGSTDETLNIISRYDHIKLIRQSERSGMYGAIQMGVEMSTGDYVCWVNCDDVIIPAAFSKMVTQARKNKVDFMCSDGIFNYVNQNKKVLIRSTRFVKYFLRKGILTFCQPSTVYTRALYDKVGGMDFKRYKIVGDLDLFYKMAKVKNARFGYIPVTSTIFLKYGNSLGDNNSELAEREKAGSGYLPNPSIFDMALFRIARILHI